VVATNNQVAVLTESTVARVRVVSTNVSGSWTEYLRTTATGKVTRTADERKASTLTIERASEVAIRFATTVDALDARFPKNVPTRCIEIY
jgi:hypothetical protein